METKSRFPLAVKRDSVTVKIYRTGGQSKYVNYMVGFREDGKRVRQTYASLETAKAEAAAIAERLAKGSGDTLLLKGAHRLEYARAAEALLAVRRPLDVVVREYAEAIRLLDGKAGVLEAIRYYAERMHRPVQHRRVADVVHELLTTRRCDGSSTRHVEDLESRLNYFAQAFACEIHSIQPASLQDYLLGLKLSPRSKNNHRAAISNLFGFARLRGYISKDHDPVADVPPVKEVDQDIEIYTSTELTSMLAASPATFVPYLAVAAFAGLRQSEIERLDWRDINENYIRVRPAKERTKSRRLVEMLPNLKAWLVRHRQESGPVVPFKNPTNNLLKILQAAGVTSKHNALRHSYGSYRLAIIQDVAKVSSEMGNTAPMVHRHYRELVEVQQARDWFAIFPSTVVSAEVDHSVATTSGSSDDGNPSAT